MKPVERLIFKAVGVNPDEEMNWKQFLKALLMVNLFWFVWGMVLLTGAMKGIRDLSGHNWLFLCLSGMATGLSWLFYFKALQMGDVSKVAPIDKLSVALTIFLSILLLGEPADFKVVLGGALITCGSLVLVL